MSLYKNKLGITAVEYILIAAVVGALITTGFVAMDGVTIDTNGVADN